MRVVALSLPIADSKVVRDSLSSRRTARSPFAPSCVRDLPIRVGACAEIERWTLVEAMVWTFGGASDGAAARRSMEMELLCGAWDEVAVLKREADVLLIKEASATTVATYIRAPGRSCRARYRSNSAVQTTCCASRLVPATASLAF